MWNALRSDFQEFMTTVTEDTSNVLTKLDAGMDDDETPEEEQDNTTTTPKDATPPTNHRELREIMTLLRSHPGTYTEDLAEEDDQTALQEFLKDFDVNNHTTEIAQILEAHPDTVQTQFETLCPTQVSYEEFWKRYLYRCNEDRMARQLQEETAREREAAIEAGVTSVANFVGGAVAAVTNTIAPPSTNNEDDGINFFGAKGRPPFVMNTAVDESGDDTDLQKDEDEEEELGWDDDDDDDDDFQDEDGVVTTGQIEFTDKVAEDLKEQLKQAIEERDQIQQTVHMQAEEIKSLQLKLQGGDAADAHNSSEVEKLKLELFEKDAELAALKASVNDESVERGTNDNLMASLEKKLRALAPEQLAKLQVTVFGGGQQQPTGNNSPEEMAKMEQQIQELTATLESSNAKVKEHGDKIPQLAEQMTMLEGELTVARNNNKAMEAQLATVTQELVTAQQKEISLEAKFEATTAALAQAEQALQQKEAELLATKQTDPSTPDSISTGVKVDDAAPPATKLELDEDIAVDEGWGDDWD
ncbi:expressed unknown protein [Seminavis robusta]|uniref:BSD domain-containing protein n=1 Tax=Seminavis robusta TaxID=568900 RepID=A0A9N8HLS7_9STRA|nr:expressed unknown protein [Seminavis robusta]|eukprot:Sro700_g189610.1 n/a (530) ;mRNA; r:18042-19631